MSLLLLLSLKIQSILCLRQILQKEAKFWDITIESFKLYGILESFEKLDKIGGLQAPSQKILILEVQAPSLWIFLKNTPSISDLVDPYPHGAPLPYRLIQGSTQCWVIFDFWFSAELPEEGSSFIETKAYTVWGPALRKQTNKQTERS